MLMTDNGNNNNNNNNSNNNSNNNNNNNNNNNAINSDTFSTLPPSQVQQTTSWACGRPVTWATTTTATTNHLRRISSLTFWTASGPWTGTTSCSCWRPSADSEADDDEMTSTTMMMTCQPTNSHHHAWNLQSIIIIIIIIIIGFVTISNYVIVIVVLWLLVAPFIMRACMFPCRR